MNCEWRTEFILNTTGMETNMNEIVLYEELSMNAHPAIKTHVYDGWLLRFANGYTNRANSVNMIYPFRL